MQYLSILYRLLITFWVGGAALFTFVLTPTLLKVMIVIWPGTSLECCSLAISRLA